jgi:hypothetical protein
MPAPPTFAQDLEQAADGAWPEQGILLDDFRGCLVARR